MIGWGRPWKAAESSGNMKLDGNISINQQECKNIDCYTDKICQRGTWLVLSAGEVIMTSSSRSEPHWMAVRRVGAPPLHRGPPQCYRSADQWPMMWLMWPGSPPRHRGQQSRGGLDRITLTCICWLDALTVWDVSIGHSVTWSSTPKHTLFDLQLHGSTSVSKLLFLRTLTHCMLTANRANS